MKSDPLSVECPVCNAAVGTTCVDTITKEPMLSVHGRRFDASRGSDVPDVPEVSGASYRTMTEVLQSQGFTVLVFDPNQFSVIDDPERGSMLVCNELDEKLPIALIAPGVTLADLIDKAEQHHRLFH